MPLLLLDLPTELLLKIRDALVETTRACAQEQRCRQNNMYDNDGRQLACEPNAHFHGFSDCNPFQAFMRTNRHLWSLCRPVWWQRLHAAGTLTAYRRLQQLLAESSDICGLVQIVHFTFPRTDAASQAAATLPPSRPAIIQSILGTCSTVASISADADLFDDEAPELPTSTQRNLRSFRLYADEDYIYQDFLSMFLDQFPVLEYVSLSRVEYAPQGQAGDVGVALARLPRLEHLCMSYDEAVNDQWAQLNWATSNLKRLELSRCAKLSGEGFAALLAVFEATLEGLVLDRVEGSKTSDTLSVSAAAQKQSITAFKLPRLKTISIGRLDWFPRDVASFGGCLNLRAISFRHLPNCGLSPIRPCHPRIEGFHDPRGLALLLRYIQLDDGWFDKLNTVKWDIGLQASEGFASALITNRSMLADFCASNGLKYEDGGDLVSAEDMDEFDGLWADR